MYSDFKTLGILPFGTSSLTEEPAFIVEAIKTIDDLKNQLEAEEANRAMGQVK